MKDELDLQRLLSRLLRSWRLIIGMSIAAAVVAALAAALLPQPVLASADIVVLPNTSQLNLDPRFATRDATLLTTSAFQRQALIALASSSTLEAKVADELLHSGAIEQYEAGALLEQITIAVDGDLLRVIAGGDTAERAVTLAEAWGQNYERLVATVYSRDAAGGEVLEQQLVLLQQRYDEAQRAYEAALGNEELVTVNEQIQRVQALLDGSRQANIALYTNYLSRTQELDLLLSDAQMLRNQMANGTSVSLSDNLSSLLLRARTVQAEVAALQIQLGADAPLETDRATLLADIDSLIEALQAKRDELVAQTQRIGQLVGSNEGAPLGLTTSEQASYEVELAALLQRQEELQQQQMLLQQRRDVAFSSLEVLLLKIDEQQIAQSTPQIGVRFVSTTLVAPTSILMRATIALVIGGVAGFVFSLALLLMSGSLHPRLRREVAVAQVSELPGEKSAITRS